MNEGKSVTRVDTAIPPDDPSKPESPPDLRRRVWMVSLKRAAHEFSHDECIDVAAGLTYYGGAVDLPGSARAGLAARRLRTGGVHERTRCLT